jgi:hypothetical protein
LSLPLQAVDDQATDQNFRQVGQRFPLQAEDLGKSAKELSPQNPTPASRTINRGKAEVEFPGGSPLTKELAVSHGLGTAEVFPAIASSNPAVHVAAVASTSTTITFRGEHVQGISPAGGTKILFSWIAET